MFPKLKISMWLDQRGVRFAFAFYLSFLILFIGAFKLFKLLFREHSWIFTAHVHSFLTAGCIIGILSFFSSRRERRHVEERDRARETLQEIDDRIKKINSHIPGTTYQFRRDVDGKYSVPFASEKFLEAFGCTPEEVANDFAPLVRAVVPEDLARVVDAVEYSANNLTIWQCEFRVKLPGEQVKWMLGESTPERLEDGVVIWHGYATDITKQRAAGDERIRLQRLEPLGVLAGGIAHDFNNLLSAILGNASLVAMFPLNDKQAKAVDSILKAVNKATGLTQQLLAFAKGGIPSIEQISVSELVHDAVELFIGASSRSKCELTFEEHLWLVNADKMQISQVIQNLIINADQAMPVGGIISIDVRNIENPADTDLQGNYVCVSVFDTGVGIPSEYLSQIFDPYFTTKGEGVGTGLGLSVVYRIIEKHRGRITVDSKPGEWTVFKVYLPASGCAVASHAPEEKKDYEVGSLRVLAMDDDPMLQDLLSRLLVLLGHKVVATSDGAEAIREFKKAENTQQRFDVAILDLTIPGGIGGVDTLKELLEIRPGFPAIVSSGYADILPDGFRYALPKPYTVKSLEKVLHDAVKYDRRRKS